ncbi:MULTISPECIES: glycosyltransferase family 2 protein [unclassified Sphingomonas]|uniref:glycosyltransferase family 2 protein n=1 Tax=unclassified Sphingomonas TaxID=196159 RepID=UPI00226A2C10
MSAAPTISVVMAAYNAAELIGETLDSLAAQSFGDFEAIVVDDRSTDDTAAFVARWPDPRVRLIVQDSNGGPVLARNRGVAEARGRYVAALDHDDLCRPGRFAAQVAYLDAHPEIALLGTAADYLTDGKVTPSIYPVTTSPALIAWLSQIENPLVWSSVMLRTDAARRLDPFTQPAMLYAEDFDLYHRIRPFGGIARLDTPLLVYRQHAGGISKRFVGTMETSAARVLAEAHAATLGDRAAEIADLLVRHNMTKLPVPDRATLAALGWGIATLQATFLASHPSCSAEDIRLIRWETALRWARIGRAGLRAGTIGVADVIAVRPPHLGLGYAGAGDLLWSGLVGGVRRAHRRWTRHTLAE